MDLFDGPFRQSDQLLDNRFLVLHQPRFPFQNNEGRFQFLELLLDQLRGELFHGIGGFQQEELMDQIPVDDFHESNGEDDFLLPNHISEGVQAIPLLLNVLLQKHVSERDIRSVTEYWLECIAREGLELPGEKQ